MLEHPDEMDTKIIITVKKQLMFAIQIAYGLEYLSSRGFIHRDIAARNILVDRQESCKIGDFGLSREIGTEDSNYLSQGGKLKWMAPESIEKYVFSTASDILKRLRRGERMEKPDNCTDKLYQIMSNCCADQPSDRPSFTQSRKQIGELLGDNPRARSFVVAVCLHVAPNGRKWTKGSVNGRIGKTMYEIQLEDRVVRAHANQLRGRLESDREVEYEVEPMIPVDVEDGVEPIEREVIDAYTDHGTEEADATTAMEKESSDGLDQETDDDFEPRRSSRTRAPPSRLNVSFKNKRYDDC